MDKLIYIERLRAFEQQLLQDHLRQLEINRALGEQDGRRNLPAITDETMPPDERNMLAHYQSKVEEVGGNVRQLLYDIKDRQWQSAVTELYNWSESWVAQQVRNAKQARDRHLEESSEIHFDNLKALENAPPYSRAKTDIEASENRLQQVSRQVGRYELHQKIKHFWAITIATIIGILEVPLNYKTFFIFRDSLPMTLLFSLSLVVVMPVIAHSAGRLSRQASERPAYYIISIALSLGAVVLSYFASELRSDVLTQAPAASVPFFFTVNLLFFIAAAIASFLAHDPSILLSDAHRAVRLKRRQHGSTLAKFENLILEETERFQQKKEDIQRIFSLAESAAQNRAQVVQGTIHDATALYNQVLAIGQRLEREQQAFCHAAILCRREQNLKFRTNHAQPLAWHAPLPELTLSLHLVLELKWPLVDALKPLLSTQCAQ